MISAIALLPEADGLQNLKGVVNEISLGVVQLPQFFENVYSGTERSRPQFPPPIWIVLVMDCAPPDSSGRA